MLKPRLLCYNTYIANNPELNMQTTANPIINADGDQALRKIVYADGDQAWRNADGNLHRTNGPAIVEPNGTQHWYVNGKRHRLDGPAVVCADGAQFWYVNGDLHRTDGPAVVCANGAQHWYVNDIRRKTNKSFQRYAKLSDEDMNMLVLKYGSIS